MSFEQHSQSFHRDLSFAVLDAEQTLELTRDFLLEQPLRWTRELPHFFE